jgi:N-terminal acetyltransferase B complex non-catalytic subunit
MGKIYAGQDKCAELMKLWQNPPASLQDLMATHKDDLREIQTRLLLQQEAWPLLEEHCLAYINDAISRTVADPDSRHLWESCAWNGHVWFNLMIAVKENHDMAE